MQLPSCFSSDTTAGVLSLLAFFFCFFKIFIFKMVPRIALQCCLMFLSARWLPCASRSKYVCLDALCSGMSYSAAGHELNVNTITDILDKASLNRSTHKQGHTSIDSVAIVQHLLIQRSQ